jgi:hypothetical protein
VIWSESDLRRSLQGFRILVSCHDFARVAYSLWFTGIAGGGIQLGRERHFFQLAQSSKFHSVHAGSTNPLSLASAYSYHKADRSRLRLAAAIYSGHYSSYSLSVSLRPRLGPSTRLGILSIARGKDLLNLLRRERHLNRIKLAIPLILVYILCFFPRHFIPFKRHHIPDSPCKEAPTLLHIRLNITFVT